MKTLLLIFILPIIQLFSGVEAQNKTLDKLINKAESFSKSRKFNSALELAYKIENLAIQQDKDIIYTRAVKVEINCLEQVTENSSKDIISRINYHISRSFGRSEILTRELKILYVKNFYQQHTSAIANNINDNVLNNNPEEWNITDIFNVINIETDSIIGSNNAELTDEELSYFSHANSFDGVKPNNVRDLALLTTINCIKSFPSALNVISLKYYSRVDTFVNAFVNNAELQPIKMVAKYYAVLLKNQYNTDSIYDCKLNLMRLRNLYYLDKGGNKLNLYLQAIKKLVNIKNSSSALASAYLAEVYVSFANRYKYDDTTTYYAKQYYNKAINLCENSIKMYPKSFGAKKCKFLLTQIKNVFINITIPEYINQKKCIPVNVSYRNINKIKLSIFKISAKSFLNLKIRTETIDRVESKFISSKEYVLPSSSDYFKHTLSGILPALTSGFYYILVNSEAGADNSDKIALINVSSIVGVTHPDSGNTIIKLLERNAGKPLSNFSYSFIKQDYNVSSRQRFFTWSSSVFSKKSKIIVPNSTRSNFICIAKGADSLLLNYRSYYFRKKTNSEIKTLMTYTDRGIYKPGETVFFNSIYYSTNNNLRSIIKDANIKFRWLNPSNKELQKVTLRTNNMGSCNGFFIIPKNTRSGIYTIQTRYNSTQIRVEDVKTNTYTAKLQKSNRIFMPGQKVSLPIKVESYSGQKLANMSLKITVTTGNNYRLWRYGANGETIINSYTTMSNKNGIANVQFISIDSKQFIKYIINTEITSPSGEMSSFNFYYSLSKNPIVFKFSDGEDIHKDAKMQIVLNGINSENINMPLQMDILSVKSTEKLIPFPLNVSEFADFDSKKWNSDWKFVAFNNKLNPVDFHEVKLTQHIVGNTQHDINSQIKLLPVGRYVCRLSVNNKSYDKKYFRVIDINNLKKRSSTVLDLFCDKKQVQQGSDLSFYINSKLNSSYVSLNVTGSNGVIINKWIKLKRSQKFTIHIDDVLTDIISAQVLLVNSNHIFRKKLSIQVIPNKTQFKISIDSIDNVLIPKKRNQVTFKVTQDGKPAANVEVMVSMFDKSLDAFSVFNWGSLFYSKYTKQVQWRSNSFGNTSIYLNQRLGIGVNENFNWIMDNPFGGMSYFRASRSMVLEESSSSEKKSLRDEYFLVENDKQEVKHSSSNVPEKIVFRSNFNQTSFFYPQVRTDNNGIGSLSFESPDAITAWKMQFLAHNKNVNYGYLKKNFVTRKDFVLHANMPRYVLTQDSVEISVLISNMADKNIELATFAQLFDENDNPLKCKTSSSKIMLSPNGSGVYNVSFYVPENVLFIKCKFFASNSILNDGEEYTLPVLSNSKTVINTMPLWCKGNQKAKFTFNYSDSLANEKYSQTYIEIVSNPVWYAIQAMPMVYKPKEKSAVNQASNILILTINKKLLHEHPDIKKFIRTMSENSMNSNFYKNKQFKISELSETPWQNIAENDEFRLLMLQNLLNVNFCHNQIQTSISNLVRMQDQNGGFAWRVGMRPSFYFTLSTANYLAKSVYLNNELNSQLSGVLKSVEKYLDENIADRYANVLRNVKDTSKYIPSIDMLKYFNFKLLIKNQYRPVSKIDKFFWQHCIMFSDRMPIKSLALIGQIAFKINNKKLGHKIVAKLREMSINDKQIGMFWRVSESSRGRKYASINTQAVIIELFDITKLYSSEVEDMKSWLIFQKQGLMWNNDQNTLSAIYALVYCGDNWLDKSTIPSITINGENILFDNDLTNNYFGFYTKSLDSSKYRNMNIVVNNTAKLPVWGGVYQKVTDKIINLKPFGNAMYIEKTYFNIIKSNNNGVAQAITENDKLKTGAYVKVKLKLEVNRAVDFVVLKLPLSSCFEVVKQMSRYTWNSGISYFIEPHSSEVRIYFEHLNKGIFNIYVDLYVVRNGIYQAAPCEMQSIYAPEFSSHTGGRTISVQK